MQKIEESAAYLCPSFNSYSSDRLPETAAKISDEFKRETNTFGNDDQFEFSLAEEFYYDGQSDRFFPVFNQYLISNDDSIPDHQDGVHDDDVKVDRDEPPLSPSSSSSEAEESESAPPPGKYCMWRLRSKETTSSPPSPMSKKSSSTGRCKRWKIRDLLRRSNSDGTDSYVFLTPKKVGKECQAKKITAAGDKAVARSPMAAHEKFYVRSRAEKERVKRKSYLPYRKELVGFFVNVNVLGRILP